MRCAGTGRLELRESLWLGEDHARRLGIKLRVCERSGGGVQNNGCAPWTLGIRDGG